MTPLNYKGFEKYLKEEDDAFFGEDLGKQFHYVFMFPNGYGVSVIKHMGSYGHEKDLFEIATIKYSKVSNFELVNIAGITDDDKVIGWLTNEQVLEVMRKVKELKERL